jgi:neuroligin
VFQPVGCVVEGYDSSPMTFNSLLFQQLTHQNSFAKREKISVAIDATPQARSNSILRQEPIEITKAKSSFDYSGKIICQDVDMDMSMIDEIPFREFRERTESVSSSTCSSCCEECANSHLRPYPDPSFYQEEVTSFIENDVNVTCRDDIEKMPLSPEESLKNIQRMNCPKVLPNYPENLQFNDSTKRRSLQIPPQYYQIHQRNRPEPPPRMSSTLGRKNSKLNSSGILMTEPLKAEEPPAETIPEITSSTEFCEFGEPAAGSERR